MRRVLNIGVSDELLANWRTWFAPAEQVFCTADLPDDQRSALATRDRTKVSMEVLDTFRPYGRSWSLLDRDTFEQLDPQIQNILVKTRRKDLGTHQVWWADDLQTAHDEPLLRYIERGVHASCHDQVPEATWQRAARVLPDARQLAGQFPASSGPNCFGTVMGGAGVPDAATTWVQREPFEEWLAANTKKLRNRLSDNLPGVVFVWRSNDGQADHACVSLGDGWALNKPSQAWCSPRVVWPVRTAIAHARQPGARLHRYLMTKGTE